jgi:hypothetical protein
MTSACLSLKVVSRTTDIREVRLTSYANKPAPDECIATFRAFFRYVQKSEPSILTDKPAQGRWLSWQMRQSLANHVKHSGDPKKNPSYPSNKTFVRVWNNPTTFSIIGSRHYDYHNAKNPGGNRATVDVLYEWGENKDGNLDNQYPESKVLHTFIFVDEDGAWKLDDIYTFTGEYFTPSSMRQDFGG